MKFVNILAFISVSMISFATSRRRRRGGVENEGECGDKNGDGQVADEEKCANNNVECCWEGKELTLTANKYILKGICRDDDKCIQLTDFNGPRSGRRRY
jgi:hypothetical protein